MLEIWVFGLTVGIIYLFKKINDLQSEIVKLNKKINESYLDKKHVSDVEKSDFFNNYNQQLPAKQAPADIKDIEYTEKPVYSNDLSALTTKPSENVKAEHFNDINKKLAALITNIKSFLHGGNAWVAAGIVFFILGISFMLSYISAKYGIPPTLRIIAGCVAGIALFSAGWFTRLKKPMLAEMLQGGGIGALILTIFAAAKFYSLIDYNIAFVLMAILVIFTVILALLQNSQPLAMLGFIIGFFVPILLSTGSGNFKALYTYYTMLNIGILLISFKKYWRFLNGAAFSLTTAIGFMWGLKYYNQDWYLTVVIFATITFLIYTAINIFASLNQYGKGSQQVENIMTVATPFAFTSVMVAIGTQTAQGIAALSIGIFYFIVVKFLIWKKFNQLKQNMQLYLAFLIIFVNISLPLLITETVSGFIWAAEGAVLVVLGVRQNKLLFKYFGVILQIAAFVMVIKTTSFFNYFEESYMGFLISSIAAYISGYFINKSNFILDRALSKILGIYAIIIFYIINIFKISDLTSHSYSSHIIIIFTIISGFLIAFVSKRISWKLPQIAAFFPISAIVLYFFVFENSGYLELDRFYLLTISTYLIFFLFQYTLFVIYEKDNTVGIRIRSFVHTASLVLFYLITARLISNIVFIALKQLDIYSWFSIGPFYFLAFIYLLMNSNGKYYKFSKVYPNLYKKYAPLIIILFMLRHVYYLTVAEADSLWFIQYIPLINIIELPIIAFILGVSYFCLKVDLSGTKLKNITMQQRTVPFFVLMFLFLNNVIARAVQYYFDIPLEMGYLINSPEFHLALTIYWGITGITTMFIGAKKGYRNIWKVGAILLVLDAVKLFLFDLSKADTITRILSFLAVGIFFIIIGYVAPIPTKQKDVVNEKN